MVIFHSYVNVYQRVIPDRNRLCFKKPQDVIVAPTVLEDAPLADATERLGEVGPKGAPVLRDAL
jgi:hypothetical protein